jgi:cytochrome b561
MQETTGRYTATAITLHWLVFVLIACGWALGSYMTTLSFSPQKLRYVSWHKWLGVTVFMLAAVRVAWRLRHPAPLLPAMPQWQREAAKAVHAVLYVLILVTPITGWLFSSASGVPTVYLGMIELPDLVQKNKELATALRALHAGLNWTLLVVVCGHAAFALKHHFVDRDGVLARMLPARRSHLG